MSRMSSRLLVYAGRAPDVRACGFCHLPNGQGRPENASVAGQPAEYIVQQMRDYRKREWENCGLHYVPWS